MEYNETKLNVDISDSANEIIKNTLSKPSKSAGNACGIILDFFTNTILLPMQKYNIKAKFELEQYAKDLEYKLLEIPEDKLIEPKMNIVGPVFETLKYNMDEEDIKNMFTNLITKSLNSDYSNQITPAYVEIIKQLSPKDADFIKRLYSISKTSVPIIRLKIVNNREYRYITNYIIVINDKDYIIPDPLTIDNLLRLQLFEIPNNISLSNREEDYNKIFEKIKNSPEISLIPLLENEKINYAKNLLNFTNLGKSFINICLS